jgi:hypothetical protein
MTHITHAGSRCRTIQQLRTVKGELPRRSQGTVLNEIENLGGILVIVHWDQGIVVPAFPQEIAFTTQQEDVRH